MIITQFLYTDNIYGNDTIKKRKFMSNTDLVSLIVTTKNEEKTIERLLNSILKQTYKSYEIILVDNKSTDDTVKIAKNYPVKIYNYGPERSAQRNFGAKKSRGAYLFFLDADMELTPEVLSSCVKKIKSGKNIGGLIIPEVSIGHNYWERVKAFERSFYNEAGDETTDAARFFTREAFEKVKGYDETITGPEDWDLPERVKKLGYKIDRVKEVIYHHERIDSLLQLVRKKYYYGLGANRYLSKHKIKAVSPKTIYFLRPVFYKQWKKMITNPILSMGMFVMLFSELAGGGLGYMIGKYKKS